MVERLQAKASSIGRILTNLEKKYTSTHGDEQNIKKSPSGQQLGHPPSKKAHLRIQQIPPFNASKIRKSPSANETIESKTEDISSPQEPTTKESIKEEEKDEEEIKHEE